VDRPAVPRSLPSPTSRRQAVGIAPRPRGRQRGRSPSSRPSWSPPRTNRQERRGAPAATWQHRRSACGVSQPRGPCLLLPAEPVVRVVLPPSPTRAQTTDLLLCAPITVFRVHAFIARKPPSASCGNLATLRSGIDSERAEPRRPLTIVWPSARRLPQRRPPACLPMNRPGRRPGSSRRQRLAAEDEAVAARLLVCDIHFAPSAGRRPIGSPPSADRASARGRRPSRWLFYRQRARRRRCGQPPRLTAIH